MQMNLKMVNNKLAIEISFRSFSKFLPEWNAWQDELQLNCFSRSKFTVTKYALVVNYHWPNFF